MAGRRAQRPRAIDSVSPNDVDDAATSRALSTLTSAVQKLQGQGGWQVVSADLVVGDNAVEHGLGRAPAVCHVTPTVADPSFGYALTRATDRVATVTVIGADQPGASVLLM